MGKYFLTFPAMYLFASCLLAVDITVDTAQERTAISPYVYGSNQDIPGITPTARRSGGNRLTGYNWENNASNAGKDWYHYSDNLMTSELPVNQQNIPGIALTNFHDKSITIGAYSLLTLQMAGYVSKDKNGTVSLAETAPSDRWTQVQFAKGSAFSISPSTTDSYVYMDECVNFLVNRYGNTPASGGVKGYLLDNEPDLWNSTHPRIHPSTATCAEYVTKSIALSKAVKAVDPYAEIFGPVSYGFTGYLDFQNAPDWNGVKGSYGWFMDYYLDQMKQAAATEGKRLLDVLDVNWYPEARGGGARITLETAFDPGNIECSKARMQAPRTLWDPAYKTSTKGTITNGEDSWINMWYPEYLPLIPKLQSSITTYYPATKLAISEYNYGGESHISGGIAMADALGIFGKFGVYLATYWQAEADTSYTASAFNLYNNYDGNNKTYGDIKVKADTSDIPNMPVYASVSGSNASQLHIIAINRNYDNLLTANFTITSTRTYTSGRVWAFDSSSSTITERTAISNISNNSFSCDMNKLTACHIVLYASDQSTSTPNPPVSSGTITVRAYPNPCRSNSMNIIFAGLRADGILKIYSLTGQLIRKLVKDNSPGELSWDLKNESGERAAKGVYIYIITDSSGQKYTGKLAVIR